MSRAAEGILLARLFQTESAVDRKPDFGGVRVLLPVILPPADRTQRQRPRRFQGLAAAAWAAITILHGFPHTTLDGKWRVWGYSDGLVLLFTAQRS